MLKQSFLAFQDDISNSEKFTSLTSELKVKILSIFKTINCESTYREDFIQDCYLKIIEIAKNKKFDKTNLNDAVLNRYFERAFLTVKTKFINQYELYLNNISLDLENENGSRLIDLIASESKEARPDSFCINIIIIKNLISKSDWDFLMLFLDYDNGKLRKVIDVAKQLNVSHQAVSKRFIKIKKTINESIGLSDCHY